MKRVWCMMMALALFLPCIPAAAEGTAIPLDSYVQLGSYDDEPILWRCVAEDENGKLMFSERILCYKAYDTIYTIKSGIDPTYEAQTWEDSHLRSWLNSDKPAGEVEWKHPNPPMKRESYKEISGTKVTCNAYADEKGFLHESNFSAEEKAVMKTVANWQNLGRDELEKSENGVNFPFGYSWTGNLRTDGWAEAGYDDVSELSHIEGAAYRVCGDTMFLPDERQIYKVWERYGALDVETSEKAMGKAEFTDIRDKDPRYTSYWLRGDRTIGGIAYGTKYRPQPGSFGDRGVRPMFYLNEENMEIKSGSGRKDDPYIIGGRLEEAPVVFCNGEQVEFDQKPVEENDRILVPMRAVFEELGAEVEWDERDASVTVSNKKTVIGVQVDNPIMLVNDVPVELDAAPKLVEDRTLVPLRAISEALDAKVEWVENLNRVVIDKPELPMDFGEGRGKENWQDPERQRMLLEYGSRPVYDPEIYPEWQASLYDSEGE